GAETRQARLGGAVEPHRDDLTDMEPEQAGPHRSRDELVGATGTGHAALDGRGPVLVEVEAVDAASRIHMGGGGKAGRAIGPEGDAEDADPALDPSHIGEPSD